MKHTLYIYLLTFLFISCKKEIKDSNKEEILNQNYKEISLSYQFRDGKEIISYEEAVDVLDEDSNFVWYSKIPQMHDNHQHEHSHHMMNYNSIKVCPNKMQYISYSAMHDESTDSFNIFRRDTVSLRDEDIKVYTIDNQEYTVYKIIEPDWHEGLCIVSIVSKEHGFLLGKGDIGQYVISKQIDDSNLQPLMKNIQKDSTFFSCGDFPPRPKNIIDAINY